MLKEQWPKIEQTVNEAELAIRKKNLAEQEIFEETKIIKKEREEMGKELGFEDEDIAEIVEELEKEKEILAKTAEDLLGLEDSPERALIELRRKNLVKALREDRKIELEHDILKDKKVNLLKKVSEAKDNGRPVRGKEAILDKVTDQLEKLDESKQELLQSSPEAFYGLHLKELKELRKDLSEGRIAETDYVKKQAEDITTHLRAGKPVMIYGHLGSGKSEIAMHVARKYIGKDALVISGSKHTSLAELYGHQILSIEKMQEETTGEYQKKVEDQYKKWQKENQKELKKMTEGERIAEQNKAHDRILQTYLSQLKGGTISDFFLGPIYKAMEEGRPVIIDEVNAIPHEVLISLNHILTRKVGDKVNVQQDSGKEVVIQDGYGVIMTGNLNQGDDKYIERQDMDSAFLSRLHKIEYDYLPQETEGKMEESGDKELFHLLLARVMDKNGNIEAPNDTIDKLWNLSKVARVFQNVFAGKEVDKAYYFQQPGSRSAKYLLKENVMSLRALDNILTQWNKEGQRRELDYYIWQEFVNQSTDPQDRAYIYQQLQDRFGFFNESSGWQRPDYGSIENLSSFNLKKIPQNKSEKKDFWGPRQVVEFAYSKAPERAQWPDMDIEKTTEPELNLEELDDLEKFKGDILKKILKVEKQVLELCK